MSKPEWQEWSEEPWTVDHDLRWLDDAEGVHVDLSRPVELSRAVACVNALAGIRNPEAVGRVIEAARDYVDTGRSTEYNELVEALEVLDQEPEA